MSPFSRRLHAASAPHATTPGGEITHGELLSIADTGHDALGVTQTSLPAAGSEGLRVSNWPGNEWPAWILNTPYVYNDIPTNKGGTVPVGGMMIDGFLIPEGVYIVQFLDFSAQSVVVEGSLGDQYGTFPGIMFRGCRWRSPSPNVGMVSENGTASGGKFWFHFCDMGGLGSQPSDYCEVPIKINNSPAQVYRCHLSYCTTGTQCVGFPGTAILENYIERLTTFNTDGPHLNGVSVNGGDTCYRVERNNIVIQTPEDNGSDKPVSQTDCIAFFQDFGDFPGTGTNDDGSVGYRIKDNYLGGTGYCIYGGMTATSPASSVQNMQISGNKVTTSYWPDGGSFGPMAYPPVAGQFGNVVTNNTWADGPNVGQLAF